MTRYCLFHLYGPIASYGGTAVGEDRHSGNRPSKSAVLGLIAGSLGIRREEEEVHSNLAGDIGFSVIIEKTGIPVRDYHTVQSAPESAIKKQGYFLTRKDELDIGRTALSAIVTKRDYICDLMACVCIWKRNDSSGYSLEDIAKAISSPVFVPYLGRKSCPVSLPMKPVIIEADSIKDAYIKSKLFDDDLIKDFFNPDDSRIMIYWDSDGISGVKPDEEHMRRDNILSRKRWQFSYRKEYFGWINLIGGNF
ncbi:MAG: type I-E CRISPR-associated protein Cas5/CasD [Methanomicrobiaceae archaeon]|nr:type I-E CRISPR-associated protein Cas5/CasD [Methanomicrobiaceae archaeon]